MARSVTISEDTAESIFRDILKEDYLGLLKEIADVEPKSDKLTPHEMEDLEAWRRWRDAMETVMEYYLPDEERLKVLKKRYRGRKTSE